MANAWIIQPLPIVAATASGTSLGLPLNVGNDYAGVIWQAPTGDAALVLDLGADMPFDTVAVFGLQGGVSVSATLSLSTATAAQGGAFTGSYTTSGAGTGNFWTSPTQDLFAGAVLPVSGKGVALWSAPNSGQPTSVRYIYLAFLGLGASAAIQVARVVIGKRIQLQRNFSYGAGFGVRDLGSLDFSARAVLLRRRAKKLRTVQLTFSNVRKDEVESTTKPLIERIGNTEMIALVTDPTADAQRQNRCYFGPLVGDLSHVWRNSAAFETKLNMASIF